MLQYRDRYAQYTNASLTEQERVMYGYISEMDDVVGNITATLKEKGLYENTLIIFSSDNGAPNAPNVRSRNWPLRGFKTQVQTNI